MNNKNLPAASLIFCLISSHDLPLCVFVAHLLVDHHDDEPLQLEVWDFFAQLLFQKERKHNTAYKFFCQPIYELKVN